MHGVGYISVCIRAKDTKLPWPIDYIYTSTVFPVGKCRLDLEGENVRSTMEFIGTWKLPTYFKNTYLSNV